MTADSGLSAKETGAPIQRRINAGRTRTPKHRNGSHALVQSPERFDLPESKRATLRKEPTPRASVAATILSTAQRFCVYGKCGSCSCRPGSLIRTVNSKQVDRRMGEGAKNQPNLFDLGFLNVINAKTPRRAKPVLAGKGATAKRRRSRKRRERERRHGPP